MRLRDVNNQERDPVFVLFKELIKCRSLPPEGWSSVTAKYQHDRSLFVQLGKLNRSALVHFQKREIRRAISHIEGPGSCMDPKGLKRKQHEDYWPGDFGHNSPELLRRLVHGPPYESGKGDVEDDRRQKESENNTLKPFH
jgi:hypothetical protein